MAASLLQDVMLASVTLTVVLFGIGLVLFVALAPLLLYKCCISSWLWSAVILPIENAACDSHGHVNYWIDLLGIVLVLVLIQVVHLRCLWRSTRYLAVFRFIVLPIRKLVLPLVMFTARVESIREETPTLYFDVRQDQLQQGGLSAQPITLQTPLLSSTDTNDLSGDVDGTIGSNRDQLSQRQQQQQEEPQQQNKRRKNRLRRYKQMERAYLRDGIRHEWGWSESTLNLSQVVPVMWEHERRMCAAANTSARNDDGDSNGGTGDDKKGSVVEEFLKRFLVVTVVPDGILDFYYVKPTFSSPNDVVNGAGQRLRRHHGQQSQPEEILCCAQLSVQQGRVLHWFMYFALDSVTRSGIWFHGIGTAIERARRITNVEYCNGQTHQTQSKRNAGFDVAQHTDQGVLSQLYPWSFTCTPPKERVDVTLWPSPQQTSAGVSNGASQQDS